MVQAELLKLRTVLSTKVTVITGIVGLLVSQVLLVTLLPAIANGLIDTGETESELGALDVGSASFQLGALNPLGGGAGGGGSLSIAVVCVVLLGLFVATTDYRFGGIVTTALAQPRRLRILGSKVAATAVASGALALAFAAICIGNLAVAAFAFSDSGLVLPALAIVDTSLRGAIVVVLMALMGLAVGTIVRSQLAGVVVVISLLTIEPIVKVFVELFTGTSPLWAQLLPLSLGQAAVASAGQGLALAPAVALAILGGMVFALLAIAGAVLRRRDL